MNKQSINATFGQLLGLKTYLNENDFMSSAICIQELGIKQKQVSSLFQIPGYILINESNV